MHTTLRQPFAGNNKKPRVQQDSAPPPGQRAAQVLALGHALDGAGGPADVRVAVGEQPGEVLPGRPDRRGGRKDAHLYMDPISFSRVL